MGECDIHMTALVAVSDSGGSSGHLRRALGIPAIGDIRNCFVALGDSQAVLKALCQHRFSAVVTDGTWRYQSQLLRDYGPPLPLPELGDAFWTVTGARTRPSTLYMPRASGADCFE